jgi:hypothetical protein
LIPPPRLQQGSLSSSGGEGWGEEAHTSNPTEAASPPVHEPLSLTLSPLAGRGKCPATHGGSAKMRPYQGSTRKVLPFPASSSQLRSPKHRNTVPPKHRPQGGWTFSVFGLRISFGFRFSDFGFRVIPTDFRAPLVPHPSTSFHLAARALVRAPPSPSNPFLNLAPTVAKYPAGRCACTVKYPLLYPCYPPPKPLVSPSYLLYEGNTRGI